MTDKLRVNIVSESEISVQGHGVHTAYEEMANSLEKRDDVEVIRGHFGELVDCDIVHMHTIGPRNWRRLFQKGTKKVISAHVVPDSFVGSLKFAELWYPIAKLYLKWFYSRADVLLAVSDETADDLRKMGIKVPIKVLYNSIDTSAYQLEASQYFGIRKSLGIPQKAFMVIGVGQVQPRKRVDNFLAAAKALPDVHFVWVGGIPFGAVAADTGAMKKLMNSSLPNLHFPGILPLKDMPKYYNASDVFWLPSEQETFGLVVVEAAASNLPVMLRNIPDYDKTFGEDAVKFNDENDAVEQIKKMQSDSDYFRKYQQAAKRIADRFDSKASAEKLVNIYKDLLK